MCFFKLTNDKQHRSVKKGFSLLLTLLHPKSRGHVQLQSNDPMDPLLIDPKYMSNSEDAHMLLKGKFPHGSYINVREYRRGNPKNMATQGIQYEEKHNTICVGHHYTHTNTNNVNKHERSYKQLEANTNRT